MHAQLIISKVNKYHKVKAFQEIDILVQLFVN